MSRSPEQQFAMAKRLPMGELIKVMQGQSDAVDQSIANMVLNMKRDALVAQKGAQAVELAQAPKTSQTDVAKAQAVMQPRMEQGVAALPVGGIGEIGNMNGAGGGIVAFDDGGEVPEYAGGGIVAFQPGGAVGAPLQSTRRPGPGPTFASAFPNVPAAASAASRMPGLFGRIGSLALGPMMMFESMTGPSPDEVTRLREFDRAKEILKQYGFTDKDIAALSTQDVYRMATGYGYKPSTPAVAAAPAAPATPAAPETTVSPAPQNVVPPADESGIASLSTRIEALRKRLEKPTLEKTATEVEEMYKKAGVNMDPYAEYRASLEAEKAKTAEEKRESGWMRALEAGLGILGETSPYGFVNIGKGSQAAARGAAEDIKEFRKLDRERNRALGQIAVAENDLKRSVTDKKISRFDDALQRYNAADAKISELQLGVDLERFKLGQTRGLKVDEIALKEANDQIQKEMVTNPGLAQDPIKYRQRLNELYTGFKSALMGKGIAQPAGAPQGRVVNGVYVPAGR